ncbi:hypothetical protein [Halopseudomonas pelagia]|uniref:hypothetical protein n=1 Tax=Halopseudomonas pelagia TaxID=553151 RepID=UPI0003A9DCC5|nr:hypothetical protein [Halopseudomonas pelagia]
MKTFFAVIGFAIVLTGCAAFERLQPQERESTAMRVMLAAGQVEGLHDLRVPAAAVDDRAALVVAAEAALVQELAPLNVGRAEPVSYPVQAAFMSVSGRTDPTLYSRAGIGLIAWLPASHAEHELAAQLAWSEIVEQAATRALPQGYETEPFEWIDKSAEGIESTHRVLRVQGPLCLDWSCILDGAFTSREDPTLSLGGQMQRVQTPEVAGHGEAESFTPLIKAHHLTLRRLTAQYLEVGDGQGQWYRMDTQPLAEFDLNAFYQRLSAELPEWAYIFVGSENPLYPPVVPVVLHQGEELFFAVP